MKNSKLFALTIFAALFTFSACKSTEMAKDAMPPAPTADAMPMEEPAAEPVVEPTVQAEPAPSPSAVDMGDLIAKHIAARGGKDNIKAVKTIKMTGSVEVMGMEVEMTNYIKRPNKLRSHLIIKSMNAEVNQGYDGEKGWMQNPGSDPQPMPEEMSKSLKDRANIDGTFMDYEEKGYTLEYLGESMVNDSPAHMIKLIRAEHPESTIYINKATYLEVKIDGEGVNPQTGQPMQTETFMSDYRSVDGIQMPHVMEVKMDGSTFQKINLSKIELNVEIDDQLFLMPGMGVDIQ